MKVLDLRCSKDHVFEGWFGSEADYAGQSASGLLTCPLCDDRTIVRLPSAPRLNVSASRVDRAAHAAASDPRRAAGDADATRAAGAPPAGPHAPGPADIARAQASWLRGLRELMAKTEDVGERFPEEARRIHYGESAPRGIRGQASAADAESLRDEGIEVRAVPIPGAVKGTLQ